MNWRIHPIMETLRNYNRVHIPPPPEEDSLTNTWIKDIATIAKTTNLQARKITTKYTKECVKKAISKYIKLYETNPRKINMKVFKNLETPPLDCITDRNNNILTNPEEIAKEIHIQQTLSNKPAVPTCYFLPNHPPKCTCAVRQYPWHDLEGLVLEKRGDPQTPLHTYLDLETYNLCLKNLANNKTPGPDKIPNSILKNMPKKF